MYGFLGNNALASLDTVSGKHKQLGKPVASGEVDFSMNHVAYDDSSGLIFSTIVPDAGQQQEEHARGQDQDHEQQPEELGKHFVGIRVTDGAVIFKVAAADPLMYLRVVSSLEQ